MRGGFLKIMARLKKSYNEKIVPQMMKEFKYKNLMQVPRIEKVVLNVGLGEAVQNVKVVEHAVQDITSITGQKPVVTTAKKSIATFKLREGMPIGCMVTLRSKKMYEFLDRLINFALPRVRDFKGVSDKSFGGNGSYTIGIKEQIVFLEVDYDKIDKIRGMNVTIVTTARTNEEARSLLRYFGMPFRQQ